MLPFLAIWCIRRVAPTKKVKEVSELKEKAVPEKIIVYNATADSDIEYCMLLSVVCLFLDHITVILLTALLSRRCCQAQLGYKLQAFKVRKGPGLQQCDSISLSVERWLKRKGGC